MKLTNNRLWNRKEIRYLFFFFLASLLLCLLFYSSIILGFWGKLPEISLLHHISQPQASQIRDCKGQLIGKFFVFDRQPIPYSDLPPHLVNALIATEDARFYEHQGVDYTSLMRVFFKTLLLNDRSAGGGSTITQQLVKNLFGRKDHGIWSIPVNKIKEIIIAKRIEKIYSKKEIIRLYLNTVPFSDHTFGIESAAQKFYNTHARSLSLAQSATLIGTLKANHSYNPRLFPERSQVRRAVVIQQMQKYGYISQSEAEATLQKPIKLSYTSSGHDKGLAPYFREEVKKTAIKLLKNKQKPDGSPYDLFKDGLIVHTTLDKTMQQKAEEAMQTHMKSLQKVYERAFGSNPPWHKSNKKLRKRIQKTGLYQRYREQGLQDDQIRKRLSRKKKIDLFSWEGVKRKNISRIDSIRHYLKFLNAGMIAIEPATGAIRCYIGGIDYRFFKYDHVSQSQRQVGSTIKPFIYTAAIEQGMQPCTYFGTKAITYTDLNNWTPTNSDNENDPHLNYSLGHALSNSVNTIAVKVLHRIGIPKVTEQIRALGITAKLSQKPAMALGTDAITLKELAGAYASYVNYGRWVRPFSITKIEDSAGHVIVSNTSQLAKQAAFDSYTRQVLLEMMKTTVESGTARRLRNRYKLLNQIAGKTGTTQNNNDGWFIGIMPKLVSVTWVGNDAYQMGFKSTKLGQGANTALPIFALFLKKLNRDRKYDQYTKSSFERTDRQVLYDLDCRPQKRDGFFKRLFARKKRKKRFKRR